MNHFWFAFGLTLFAGLSTGFGSLIAFVAKTTNKKFLSVALGFSAGVMIYISMIEIFFKARTTLIGAWGERTGSWMTVVAFFTGMFFIAIIDKMIPSYENPHEVHSVSHGDFSHAMSRDDIKQIKLMRTGLFVALAIAIHNFPEGLATFIAALRDPKLGIPIAVAIAIHNIPEGVAVSVPIYYATKNKKRAFIYSFLSGLAEPAGALLGYVFLLRYLNDTAFGFIFASVAGIMVFISFDELLPAAKEYGEHHLSIYGLVSGMIVMAVSLLLFV
ncbi:MAG: zinc transporter ZupT [Pseudomonadota bacterium]